MEEITEEDQNNGQREKIFLVDLEVMEKQIHHEIDDSKRPKEDETEYAVLIEERAGKFLDKKCLPDKFIGEKDDGERKIKDEIKENEFVLPIRLVDADINRDNQQSGLDELVERCRNGTFGMREERKRQEIEAKDPQPYKEYFRRKLHNFMKDGALPGLTCMNIGNFGGLVKNIRSFFWIFSKT